MRLEHLRGGGVRAHAPAKVNLYLEILGVRPDGYHEIDSVMQEVSLFDEIDIVPLPRDAGAGVRLEVVDDLGARLPDLEGDSNLVLRAARLFLERAGSTEPLAIRLTKRVPMGAGLGG